MKPVDRHAIEPEFSPRLLLASIYLWPFFAVWSFNRPSWSGLNRTGFNRFNGILILCLLDFFAVLTFLPRNLLHALTQTGAIGIYLVLLVAHWFWLDGSRGERLKVQFRDASAATKLTARVMSAALFGSILVWFFVSVAPSNAHPSSPIGTNCKKSIEVTALDCDAENHQLDR